jgi:hypothetical protein
MKGHSEANDSTRHWAIDLRGEFSQGFQGWLQESNVLPDLSSNPQLSPQHETSCKVLKDLRGVWQSPRFSKSL